MLNKPHNQATTTPKLRAAIQASDEPAWVLAERHGTTEQTVWKWRKRDNVEDCSHKAAPAANDADARAKGRRSGPAQDAFGVA